VVFGILVNLPEIVESSIGQNILDAQHGGHHGVVLVVVFVHAVAADEVQIWITAFQFLPNRRNVSRVIVIVNRIRFFLANDGPIDNVTYVGQADFNQLPFGKLD